MQSRHQRSESGATSVEYARSSGVLLTGASRETGHKR